MLVRVSFGIRLPNGLAPSSPRPKASVSLPEFRCAVYTFRKVWLSKSRQARGRDRQAAGGLQRHQQLRRQGSTLAALALRRPVTRTRIPSSTQDVQGGGMKHCRKPNSLQFHHELFPTHTGVMRCLAQPLRGSTTQRKHFSTNTP